MAKGSLKAGWTALLLLAGACAEPAPPPPQPAPPPVASYAPPPAPPPPVARPAPRDACGAIDLQYLVGRPRTEIPVPVDPSHRRVMCVGCPATSDSFSSRQTILYDRTTGLVTSITCG